MSERVRHVRDAPPSLLPNVPFERCAGSLREPNRGAEIGDHEVQVNGRPMSAVVSKVSRTGVGGASAGLGEKVDG